jgi:nicotinamidase-related amidase
MLVRSFRHVAIPALAFAAVIGFQGVARAQTIIDHWSSVAAPAAPALKQANLDAKTTALLVMDFVKQTCTEASRPSCVASIPKVKAMIAAAKAKGVTVIWTVPPGPKPEDFLPDVAPPAGTKFVIAPVDKFYNTDLEKQLKDKGITTLVLTGTSAYGAVMFTGSAAAVRGFNIAVPVDGMSAAPAYGEQAAAWILANLPGAANKVTMTRGDMIAYH